MNEYFPVEVLPTTVPMHVHPVCDACLGAVMRSPCHSIRWPEPPVAAFRREYALGEGDDTRIAAFERLAQQDNLVLALYAPAHPRRHLRELVNYVQSDGEAVRGEQAARVQYQIKRSFEAGAVFKSLDSKRQYRRGGLQIACESRRIVPDPLLPSVGPFVLRTLAVHRHRHDIFAILQHDIEQGRVIEAVRRDFLKNVACLIALEVLLILELI